MATDAGVKKRAEFMKTRIAETAKASARAKRMAATTNIFSQISSNYRGRQSLRSGGSSKAQTNRTQAIPDLELFEMNFSKTQLMMRNFIQDKVFSSDPDFGQLGSRAEHKARIIKKIVSFWVNTAGAINLRDCATYAKKGCFDKYTDLDPQRAHVQVQKLQYLDQVYHGQVKVLAPKSVLHEAEQMLSLERNWTLKNGEWNSRKRLPNQQKNLVPHGIGRMCHCGISSAYIFEGYFRNGVPHGFARWILDDGSIYMGPVKAGRPDGQGQLIMGSSYKDFVQNGTWKNGVLISGEVYHEDVQNRENKYLASTLNKQVLKQMQLMGLQQQRLKPMKK